MLRRAAAIAVVWGAAALLTMGAYAAEPEKKVPGRWALLIGVNDYANLKDLRFCCADMEGLRDELVAGGFPADHVFSMGDNAAEARYRPSKGNIERQVKLVLSLARPGDFVVLAFSGHGVLEAGASYWCPTDADPDQPAATMVTQDFIYDALEQSQAAFKLVLVDACRNELEEAGAKSIENDQRIEQFARALENPPAGILMLTSCSPKEKSMEDAEFGHGVFMHFVLEGLRGSADDDQNGLVTLRELWNYSGDQTQLYVAKRFNGFQQPRFKGDLTREAEQFPLALASAAKPKPLAPPAAPKPGEVLTNSIGMRLVAIPAGEFLMGNGEAVGDLLAAFPTAKGEWFDDEFPQHRVRITRPFYLGQYEVTKGQFAQFVAATGYRTEAEKDGQGGYGWNGAEETFEKKPEYTWRSWGVNQSDASPVVNVSWHDAVAFCEWLSNAPGESPGAKYGLPTEAQWEYACRAGSTTRYHHGDDPEGLASVGNVSDATAREMFRKNYSFWTYISARDGYAFTSPAGRFRPNAFGLYDMHGNVWEWCADWYGEDYYGNSPVDDPPGPSSGSFRVCRGGGWFNGPVYCRSADRSGFSPGQ